MGSYRTTVYLKSHAHLNFKRQFIRLYSLMNNMLIFHQPENEIKNTMYHNSSNISNTAASEDAIPEDCINNLTVDNLIFTLHEGKLKVLLV